MTRLLEATFESMPCPWTKENSRHDHQLIFPMNDGCRGHGTPRTPLTAAISHDEGDSWDIVGDIDARENFHVA